MRRKGHVISVHLLRRTTLSDYYSQLHDFPKFVDNPSKSSSPQPQLHFLTPLLACPAGW